MHMQAEIEVLKQALVDKQSQLIAMETACLRESDRQVELEDSIIAWQDKYDRLYESHKRAQKVNQSLEDKLLKLVDRNSGERAQLTSDVATLSVRLAQANYNIAKLQREIERYKTDINLAIQLLQCKPDSFVSQKVSSLPMDIQSKVSTYMRLETNSHSDSEGSTSGVGVATSGSYKVLPVSDSPPPLCPFPPTAMVYSMRGLDAQMNSDGGTNSSTEQMISPSVMAKYLEDELKASEIKHCDTCNCSTKDLTVLADEPKTYSVGTQTVVHGEGGNSLCLRCNSNLNSPSRTNSPYIMKLVKSSDSVISETKSSVSDLLDNEKLFTPVKKDDLMVNPILGHHRLCDRTINKQTQQQLCDTAKYIVETRKLENEIADLRKFNNKSPNVNLSTDLVCNSFSHSLANEVKLGEAAIGKPNDESIAILVDTGVDGEAESNSSLNQQQQQQVVKQQGDTSSTDKKTEAKSQQDSNDKTNNAAMGSTNSLWSKTSSSEGAKIFENFNRNLIKTIKAENPTNRGPRLCALRIQNGSNNILLDNIESEIMPIVYTRPSRFLDEELDDTKDIITSKISMLMSKQKISSPQSNSSSNLKPIAQLLNNSDLISATAGTEDVSLSDNNKNSTNDKFCDSVNAIPNSLALNLVNDKPPPQLTQNNEIVSSMLAVSNETANDRNTSLSALDMTRNQILHLTNCQDQNCNGFVDCTELNKQHYEILTLCDNSLNSSFKNTTSKSCTQSSSISSSGLDIDLQESALLRRQQLTRVAEWVQNNTQQQLDHKSTPNNLLCNNVHITSNNCNNMPPTTLSQSSNSIEILSIDSGYKTTKPIPNGVYATLNNNFHHYHNNSQQLNDDSKLISSHQISSDLIAQNNCFTFNHNMALKYYTSDNGKTISIQPKVDQSNHQIQQPVDLAQMEYNVKQFLLKQNEWSIRNANKSSTSSMISVGQTSTVINNCTGNGNDPLPIVVKNHSLPHRTETNL